MTKSGATCFETVDDLGGADGLAGNSLEARSQDGVTNFKMVETKLNPEIAHWREHVDVLRQYKPASDEFMDEVWGVATSHMRKDGMTYSEEITIPEYNECQCGFDPDCGLAPWQNSGSQPNITIPAETAVANTV